MSKIKEFIRIWLRKLKTKEMKCPHCNEILCYVFRYYNKQDNGYIIDHISGLADKPAIKTHTHTFYKIDRNSSKLIECHKCNQPMMLKYGEKFSKNVSDELKKEIQITISKNDE